MDHSRRSSKSLKHEGALAGLVKSVSKHENTALQKLAREALECFAGGGEELRLPVLDESPALAGLVNSVFEEYNPDLQDKASGTS